MFSGLIQKKGTVVLNRKSRFKVASKLKGVRVGDSISVNGTCLTVTHRSLKNGGELSFDIAVETRNRTTLRYIRLGTSVNLEKALSVKDLFGGHLVQGHVDGTGQIAKIIPKGKMKTLWIKAPARIGQYLLQKGSVAVDGVSLTIAKIKENQFSVALIPHTLKNTNLETLKRGDRVNLEADVMAKYVYQYVKNK